MGSKRISIDPITRLEGHGKIELFLDEQGELQDAFFQIPELRGFEQFCRGRCGEDMPQITQRICGVCPEAHHLASVKTLDACYAVRPPDRSVKLRELLYNAYIFSDHLLHFYYLGGPDFILGPDTPAAQRNILGVVEKVGPELAGAVIKHRSFGQKIIEIIGGRPIHPVTSLPGGQSKGITEEERSQIELMLESCVEFACQTNQIFKELYLAEGAYREFLLDEAQRLPSYSMGTVDRNGSLNFYDGKVRIVNPEGDEFAFVEAEELLDLIAERTEPWTYVKIPYLKDVGWTGYTGGMDSGLYRVGPLGRLNVCNGISTSLAQAEFESYQEFFGGTPVHATFAYHWARIIEMLAAAEMALDVVRDPALMEGPLRATLNQPGTGVGVIEAARGTLIHHYQLDSDGIVEGLNLIVATTHNIAGISTSIKQMASSLIHAGDVDPGVLNRIEMSFRNYDPCLACATHALPGQIPLLLQVRDPQGKIVQRIFREEGSNVCVQQTSGA